ncbi:tetratricopeptide repeat protein [Methylomagnum ishizawai]|uniref:tetratricopeptide repeat protein n=1 Tax=Methylomagnum ishizawai TaxID=1760988 RepID=UPI001C337D6A|nr:tetratricopeptide repeat protein [Methylomagnum ishizawai]BBL73042.1 hypothetical protein MishRS11D_01400 [Methylomagnum ishizawai]
MPSRSHRRVRTAHPPGTTGLIWILGFFLVLTAIVVATVLLNSGQEEATPVASILNQADALWRPEQAPKAVALLKAARATHPGTEAEIDSRLGMIYQKAGLTAEALPYLDRSVRLGADMGVKANALRRLIRAQLGVDNYDAAQKLVKTLPPDDPEVERWRLIMRTAQQDDPAQALAVFRELAAATPSERESQRRLGRAELDQQRWAEAAQTLALALERFPDDMEFLGLAGDAAYRDRDYGRSKAWFERLVDLERQWSGGKAAHTVELARAQIALDQRAPANALLDAFLAQQPDHAEALFYRALSAFRDGDYQTAYDHISLVAPAHPSWTDCNLLAGAAALALDRVESARTHLALFANPAGPETGKHLLRIAQAGPEERAGTLASGELKHLFDNLLR